MANRIIKNKKWIILALILVLVILQSIWFFQWKGSGSICHGVTINGIPVGLLSVDEARSKVNSVMKQWLQETGVDIKDESDVYHVNAKDIASYDVEETVEEAMNIGRTGSILRQFTEFISLAVKKKDVPSAARINWDKLLEETGKAKAVFEKQGQDASILGFDMGEAKGKRIKTTPHRVGRTLQVEETAKRVYNAIMENVTTIEPIIVDMEPEITDNGLRAMEDTPVFAVRALLTSEAVVETPELEVIKPDINMEQACAKIEAKILQPNEELSMKAWMGYDAWTSLILDEGVTTHMPSLLYECAARAELSILEHHSGASMASDQYSPGQEAVIDGSKDLVIKNEMTYPVVIYMGYEAGKPVSRLICEIYRPSMEFKTHLKSVITYSGGNQVVQIYRIYTSEKGGHRGKELVDEVVYKD